jgi:hypothetical protein
MNGIETGRTDGVAPLEFDEIQLTRFFLRTQARETAQYD